MTINGYQEFVEALGFWDYTVDDIGWISVGKLGDYCSVDDFLSLLYDFNYDSGYGTQEMRGDIRVIMKDCSWFERKEYDGSEWWGYVVIPRACGEKVDLTDLWSEDYKLLKGIEH